MWLAATTCLIVSAVLLVSTRRTRGKPRRATALHAVQADMRRLKATVSRVRVLHVLQESGWILSATQTHLTAYHVKRARTERRVRQRLAASAVMAVLRSHCAAKRHVMRAAPVSILRWVRHRARLAWLEHMITTAVLRRDARFALPARFQARVQLYARVVVLARVTMTVTLPRRALGVSSGNTRT